MPAVNGVGEPCAGEPHARIDVAGAGNGARNLIMVTGVGQPSGNRGRHEGPRTYRQEKPPRQLPTLLNVRRYRGKLLIKPSNAAPRRIRERLSAEMLDLRGANAEAVIQRLSPI
jgi:hypothetical protein